MKAFYICMLTLCSALAYAQPNKVPKTARTGYIVMADGDSQQVWLVQGNLIDAQRQVVAYDQNGARKQYQAAQLARYYDGQYLRHAVRVNKDWYLLALATRGAASLYHYYYPGQNKTIAAQVIYKQGMEPEKFDPNTARYKKQIREYFNDYPPAGWDEFDRGYEITELERLVADYNKWVAAGKPKLQRQKPNPNND